MRKRKTSKERQELCDKWRASGLSQKVFCAQIGISTKTLGLWLKPRSRNADLKFLRVVEADASENKPEQSISGEIFLARGIKIKVVANQMVFTDFIRGLAV